MLLIFGDIRCLEKETAFRSPKLQKYLLILRSGYTPSIPPDRTGQDWRSSPRHSCPGFQFTGPVEGKDPRLRLVILIVVSIYHLLGYVCRICSASSNGQDWMFWMAV